MKKIFTLIIGILFSITILNSQVAPPQAFSFKATIKDKYGLPVLLKKVNLRITVLLGDLNGYPVYSEYFKPTTDLYSQVDVQIGQGTVLSGDFPLIDWSANKYFLKIEVDINGGNSYQLLSVTQLLSVPYALYAGKAGNTFSGKYGDLTGVPVLSLVATTGQYSDLSGKPTLFSGSYNDLTNKPTFFSGNYNDLSNQPTLFDGTWNSLTGKPAFSTIALSGSWKDLINTPTTLAGYGITDAMNTSHPANGIAATDITNWNTAFSWGNHAGLYRPIGYVPLWDEITKKPTTLAGFGITDAVNTTGDQTITGNKTFTGNTTVPNALHAGNGFASIYNATEKIPLLGAKGNVSIGTDSKWDWSELDVNGGINVLPGQWDWGSGIALSAWDAQGGGGEQYLIGSTGVLAHEGAGKFFIRNTNHYWDAIFIMDNQGRVGIHLGFDGLPQHTLDVGGDINFTGNLLKNGSPYSFVTSWSEINDKPTFETVATSGSYNDLTNKPIIDGSETKLIGGTNATVTGVGTAASPYVINSNGGGSTDAVTITGDQTITGIKTFSNKLVATQEGVGTTTPNASAALEISSTIQGFLPPRMTQAQRDAITPVAGLQIFNTSTHRPNYYDGTEWQNFDGTSAKTLTIKIGDSYQGGKVAYILQPGDPGYDPFVLHGLIAAPSDQSEGIQWYNGIYTTTLAAGMTLGTGNANTVSIINSQGILVGSYAALLCYNLELGGYTDWYLPSRGELNELYLNRTAIGGFTPVEYWSSTELNNNVACIQSFNDGRQDSNSKDNTYHVRAIRSF